MTTQTKNRIFDKKNPLGCLENDSTKAWRGLETKLSGSKRLSCFAQINESSSQSKIQHFSLFSKNVHNAPKNIQNSLFSKRSDDVNCLDLKLKEISLENLLNVTGENCAKLIAKKSQHQQQQLHSSSQLPFDINGNLLSKPSSLNIPSATATNPLLFQCNFQLNSKQSSNQSAFPTTTNETNPTITNNSISNPIILQNLINAVVATQHQQQQQQQEQKQKQILQAALIKLLLVTQNDDNVLKLINVLIGVLTGTNSDNNMSRYKTELCRNFEETGDCKYGKKCQFAHGSHELRNIQRHPKYKTELCRSYHNTGFCPYGLRCHFVHNVEEARTTNLSTVTTSTTNISTTNLQQNMISKIFTNNIIPLTPTESQWSPNFILLNKTSSSTDLETSTNVVGSDGNGNDSLSIDTQNSEFKTFSPEFSTNTSSGLGSSSSNSIDYCSSSSESINSVN